MPRLWAQVAVVLSALPIGTGPFTLAKLYDREAALTSRAILISTLCSVVSVSLLIVWLRRPERRSTSSSWPTASPPAR